MKNRELQPLVQAIDACGNLQGLQFAYGLAKNRNLLIAELKLMQKANKHSNEFKEYDQKRVKLAENMSKRNEDGTPMTEMMQNGEQYVIENKPAFNKKLKDLQEEYKDALAEQEKKNIEFESFLDEESSFVPFKIKQSYVPENISVTQMNGIVSLIEEV